MKLIKILFFMSIVVSMCGVVSAYEVYEGEVSSSTYSQTNEQVPYTTADTLNMENIGLVDGGLGKDLKSVSVMININAWAGSLDYSYIKQDVVYEQGAIEKGTGYMYYWLMNTDDDPEYEKVYIKCYFDGGLDLGSGVQIVDIVGDITSLIIYDRRKQFVVAGAQKQCFLGDRHLTGNSINAVEGYHSANHEVHFYNNYSYWYDEDLFNFKLTRNASNPSMLLINNTDTELINETSYNNVVTSVYSDDIVNDTWDIEIYDINTVTHTFQIDFVPVVESEGTIELNQSSYTDPEHVQIDVELITYDFDDHLYRILMYYSDDGGATWDRLTTSLNASSILSSASESRTSDISSGFYDLPIKIKAVLEDYDKTTTTSSVVATSSEVYYNPTAAYDYTFSGTVFDAGTGSPIEGATIAATGATTTSDTSTVTGRFKLYLSDGTYTINCSKSGYVSNVNEDIVVWTNISLYNIYLTQTSYTNGTMNGIIKDVDTDESLQDVHLIFTNATDRIDAYTSTGGYYTASGFAQSETYTIRAIKSGYYSYNGSVTIAASGGTHKSFDMIQINYSVTPTATVLDTYPDGEGHAWTNDEIVTMLRIVVPGVFMMMFIFLLLAVLMGVGGNNGGNGGQGMGMKELWQR